MKCPYSNPPLWPAQYARQNLPLAPGGTSGYTANPGQLNRNPANALALTADWVWANPRGESWLARDFRPVPKAKVRVIEGDEARRLGHQEKWDLLSPFLKQHGREGIAYATLQEGMEYFLTKTGYIAYTRVRHPLFARRPKRIVLSDPICATEDLPDLIRSFLSRDARRFLRHLRAVRRSAAPDGLQGELHRV
jgi:hypothetical protein